MLSPQSLVQVRPHSMSFSSSMGKEDFSFLLKVFSRAFLIFHHSGYPADVAMEGPSFSKPDAGLLADMLAEQTSRGTERPFFGNDSSTGTYLILLLLPDLLFD